eukprot:jgi/Phyca11/15709/fgenesh1_pg.PHYCAscaffold_15_\
MILRQMKMSPGDDGRNNRRGRAIPAAAAGAQAQEDDLENMDWWDNLTAGQQRSMMKRFLIQPPAAAAAAPAPVIVNAPAAPVPRQKMKTLNLADFRGTSAESVEAWLATIPQEVERQAGLGGDTWTAEELYYGVTAHLKDAASMWLITMTEDMRPEDKTLSYLVKKMRKKYGRRDNIFKIQQRLAAREQQPGERLSDFAAKLMDIGFGKRVPAESYVEAFLNGINNQTAAMQIRGRDPRTLEDALQYAEDTCGEYGEGFKVTDWRVAKRRYRDDRGMGAEEEGAPPAKRKASVTSMMEQLDWNKLGFGLSDSAEAPPQFDVHGNPENRMSKAMKADPLSIAALQALILTAGTRHQNDENSKSTASKTKARVLEMKAEPAEEMKTAVPAAEEEDNQQTGGAAPRSDWRNQNAGGSGRRYGGQSNLANYGPAGDQPIQQQKANTNCGYCVMVAGDGKDEVVAVTEAGADASHEMMMIDDDARKDTADDDETQEKRAPPVEDVAAAEGVLEERLKDDTDVQKSKWPLYEEYSYPSCVNDGKNVHEYYGCRSQPHPGTREGRSSDATAAEEA